MISPLEFRSSRWVISRGMALRSTRATSVKAGRLLLRHAVERAEPEHEVGGVDAATHRPGRDHDRPGVDEGSAARSRQ
jgi:hypothetical protein